MIFVTSIKRKEIFMSENNPFDGGPPLPDIKFESILEKEDFDNIIKDSNNSGLDSNKQRNNNIWIGAVTFFVLLFAFGFGGYLLADKVLTEKIIEKEEFLVAPEPELSQSGEVSSETPTITNPISELTMVLPPVTAAEIIVTTTAENIVAPNSKTLNIDKEIVKVQAPSQGCVVINPNDFCFAGNGTLVTDKIPLEFYYLKDAAHSRMFDNATNFEEVTIKGAAVAGTMNSGSDANSLKLLTIINDDSSGFMIRLPEGASTAHVNELIGALTVS